MINLNRAIEMRNAYNFIIDSINDDHSIDDIIDLDNETLNEFAIDNNSTARAIRNACAQIEMMR